MLDYMVSLYRTVPVSSERLSDWLASWLAQQQTRCHDHHFLPPFHGVKPVCPSTPFAA